MPIKYLYYTKHVQIHQIHHKHFAMCNANIGICLNSRSIQENIFLILLPSCPIQEVKVYEEISQLKEISQPPLSGVKFICVFVVLSFLRMQNTESANLSMGTRLIQYFKVFKATAAYYYQISFELLCFKRIIIYLSQHCCNTLVKSFVKIKISIIIMYTRVVRFQAVVT